jgi:hypothetical protein
MNVELFESVLVRVRLFSSDCAPLVGDSALGEQIRNPSGSHFVWRGPLVCPPVRAAALASVASLFCTMEGGKVTKSEMRRLSKQLSEQSFGGLPTSNPGSGTSSPEPSELERSRSLSGLPQIDVPFRRAASSLRYLASQNARFRRSFLTTFFF